VLIVIQNAIIDYILEVFAMNKIIVSGVKPTGNLHLGNYFGAIKHHIELQNAGNKTIIFLADLHALTSIKDKKLLEENVLNLAIDYLSLGIDPEKTIFFRQSEVVEHSELAIILANYISHSQMQRMHAYKDIVSKDEQQNINMGLFNYPILMAADILVYRPDGVPVGIDQKQHVELTRDIAQNFNKTYSLEFFKLPEPIIDKGSAKIVGPDGQNKMSKTKGNIISIFESEDVIRKQIRSCYTDPTRIKATDPGHIEGNTVFLYLEALNYKDNENLKTKYIQGKIGDMEVKDILFETYMEYFKEAREKRALYLDNLDLVRDILKQGAKSASEIAKQTLDEVKEIIGLKSI
jgi:tryptophanyl-tRNA synthetase